MVRNELDGNRRTSLLGSRSAISRRMSKRIRGRAVAAVAFVRVHASPECDRLRLRELHAMAFPRSDSSDCIACAPLAIRAHHSIGDRSVAEEVRRAGLESESEGQSKSASLVWSRRIE